MDTGQFGEPLGSSALPSGFVPNPGADGASGPSGSTGTEGPALARSRGIDKGHEEKIKRRQEVQRRYREKIKARQAEREGALEAARREVAQLRLANRALEDMVAALEILDVEGDALAAVLTRAGPPPATRHAADPHSEIPHLDAHQTAVYALDVSFDPDVTLTEAQIRQVMRFPAEVLVCAQIEFIRRLEQHMAEWAVCYASRPHLERILSAGMSNRIRMLRIMSERTPDTHIKILKRVAVAPGTPAAAAAGQRMRAIVADLGLSEQQRAALAAALRQFRDSIAAIRADAAMAHMTLSCLADMGGGGGGDGPSGSGGGGFPGGAMPPGAAGAGGLPPALAAALAAAGRGDGALPPGAALGSLRAVRGGGGPPPAPDAAPSTGPAGAAGRRPKRMSAKAVAAMETAALIGEGPFAAAARTASGGNAGSATGAVHPHALAAASAASMAQRAQDALAAADALATLQRLPYRMLHARTVIAVQALGALTTVQAAKVILGCRPSMPDHAMLCEVATAGWPAQEQAPAQAPGLPPGQARPGQLPWPFT